MKADNLPPLMDESQAVLDRLGDRPSLKTAFEQAASFSYALLTPADFQAEYFDTTPLIALSATIDQRVQHGLGEDVQEPHFMLSTYDMSEGELLILIEDIWADLLEHYLEPDMDIAQINAMRVAAANRVILDLAAKIGVQSHHEAAPALKVA